MKNICRRLSIFLGLFLLPMAGHTQNIITTVAGGGTGGDGSLATNAGLTGPNDVYVDDTGNIYIVEEFLLWRVDKATGIIHRLAGDGNCGVGGDGVPLSQAKFCGASAIAFDNSGNFYIADLGNHVIRKVDKTTGTISVFAGNWTLGYSGDGGPATSAQLNHPTDICFDASGNLYIADRKFAIRKVDAQTGIISTIAGNGVQGSWSNGQSAVNAQLGELRGLCIDQAGDVYFADMDNRKIGRINASGILSTYCGTGVAGTSGDWGLASNAETYAVTKPRMDKSGSMFFWDPGGIRRIDGGDGRIARVAGNGSSVFSGDGGPALSAGVSGASTFLDKDNNLFIADVANYRIRKVTNLLNVKDPPSPSFNFYPNPSQSDLIISSADVMKKVEIHSLVGKLIYLSNPNSKTIQIDLGLNPDGVYLVTVYADEGSSSGKLILYH